MNAGGLSPMAFDALMWLGSPQLTNVIYIVNGFILFLTLGVVSLSAGVAALVWRMTSQHNADEHVHRLFSEYLKLRSGYEQLIDLGHDSSPHILSTESKAESRSRVYDMSGMKLYILEEMYNWLLIRRKAFDIANLTYTSKEKSDAADNLESWHRTILIHALEDFDNTRKSLFEYSSCYSASFIDYIANGSKCPRLLRLAEAHNQAVAKGERRPPWNGGGRTGRACRLATSRRMSFTSKCRRRSSTSTVRNWNHGSRGSRDRGLRAANETIIR